MKKFDPLNVSSKFAICGLPIRVDTYKTCSFGCKYCFANYRKIMEFKKELQIANLDLMAKRLNRIFNQHKPNNSLLETFIAKGITWHCGGMSDPFQPINSTLKVTNEMIDITNKYAIPILFSTKSDSIHNADIRKDLHTFQLSISNVDNRKDIEPNVPSIESRLKFYKELKQQGFKVGIRIQPFIPDLTNLNIVVIMRNGNKQPLLA